MISDHGARAQAYDSSSEALPVGGRLRAKGQSESRREILVVGIVPGRDGLGARRRGAALGPRILLQDLDDESAPLGKMVSRT